LEAPKSRERKTPLLSVIVLSWNACGLLQRCLRSVSEAISSLNTEVIVVDNGSTDGSPDLVSEEFPSFRLIELRQNLGFAGGNNVGIREAQGKYILLLNSDTEILGDGLERMVSAMEEDPRLGAVGPTLVSPDGSAQISWYPFPSLRIMVEAVSASVPGFRWLHRWVRTRKRKHTGPIDAPMGACLMVRRDALTEVGLLDRGYYLYAEELDLCFRLKQASWKRKLVSEARVIHVGGGSSTGMGLASHWKDSHRWFFRKHRSPFSTLILELILLFTAFRRKRSTT